MDCDFSFFNLRHEGFVNFDVDIFSLFLILLMVSFLRTIPITCSKQSTRPSWQPSSHPQIRPTRRFVSALKPTFYIILQLVFKATQFETCLSSYPSSLSSDLPTASPSCQPSSQPSSRFASRRSSCQSSSRPSPQPINQPSSQPSSPYFTRASCQHSNRPSGHSKAPFAALLAAVPSESSSPIRSRPRSHKVTSETAVWVPSSSPINLQCIRFTQPSFGPSGQLPSARLGQLRLRLDRFLQRHLILTNWPFVVCDDYILNMAFKYTRISFLLLLLLNQW